MENRMVRAIEWKNGRGVMLDQSRLPVEVEYVLIT